MRRNRVIVVLMALAMTPFLWLVLTTDWSAESQGVGLAVGSALTGAVMAWALHHAHQSGYLLPHRCENCDRPLQRLRKGALLSRDGTPSSVAHRWHCRYCGRLL